MCSLWSSMRTIGTMYGARAAHLKETIPVSKSVNKVILIGNLGQDPEVKYTPGGKPVAKFSLATNERYKDKSGEWQDRAEWHNIVAWERLAELTGEYLKKGSKVFVEGRLQTSSWDDRQTGGKKYRTEIIAQELVFLGRNENPDAESVAPERSTAKSRPNGHSRQVVDFDQSTQITDEDIPF